MYPPAFDYLRVETVEDALDALAGTDGDAQLLAGGHGLLPELKTGGAAPDVLVDIGPVDRLASIEATDEGVVIGALATHADLVDSEAVAARVPELAAAAPQVGDLQIRNRGTVGGNLVEAAPGADLPAAMLAGEATIHVESPSGSRTLAATDFFTGGGETAIDDDELLVELTLPGTAHGAYVKKTNPATGYAMVGVAAALAGIEGGLSEPRVAVTGVTDSPCRLPTVEDALAGLSPDDPDGIAAAATRAREDIHEEHLYGDAQASGAFRLELLGPHVERAVREAIATEAGGSS